MTLFEDENTFEQMALAEMQAGKLTTFQDLRNMAEQIFPDFLYGPGLRGLMQMWKRLQRAALAARSTEGK